MRVSEKMLHDIVARINKAAGTPETYSTKNADGSYGHTNIGHYHLDMAYGGYKLVQTGNEYGGIHCISINGYTTKRDLYDQLQSMLTGLSMRVA